MENLSKLLKEKREQAGLSIEDVCEKTRLTQKHIKALEEGNMEFFREDLSYMRFFVKSYCEAVGIDYEDVKDLLRDSIDDYTQTISLSAIKDHEEMEKNIARSERLTKVNDTQEKPHVRKKPKIKGNVSLRKRIDFSLLSFISAVIVVVAVVATALWLFVQSRNDGNEQKVEEQPIVNKQEQNGKNDYPNDKEAQEEPKEKKEIEITKVGVSQYTIDNATDGEELDMEIYFGNSSSDFSMMVNGEVLNEPTPKVYLWKETLNTKVKVKENMKMTLYFGWFNQIQIKINGKVVNIDESIMNSDHSCNLEFTVLGE